MRVLRYRLRRGSGGVGWSGGGAGIERDLHVLEDARVWLITERRVKCRIQLKVGDVLRMLTPGGGGWGGSVGEPCVRHFQLLPGSVVVQ